MSYGSYDNITWSMIWSNTGCTMEFDKTYWKEATFTWPHMHSFWKFDNFGPILARICQIFKTSSKKNHHVSHFSSSFWRFDKFEPKSVRICQIFKTSNKKKLSNYQNEARDWPFEEKFRRRLLVRKCQIIKTIAYQATWPWPLSNGFCQISKYIPL